MQYPQDQIIDIDLNISYCKNTLENFNQLLEYGDLAYSNLKYEDFKGFDYLILDENEFIEVLDISSIGKQYTKEIVFNKTKNRWEYVLNSSQNMAIKRGK